MLVWFELPSVIKIKDDASLRSWVVRQDDAMMPSMTGMPTENPDERRVILKGKCRLCWGFRPGCGRIVQASKALTLKYKLAEVLVEDMGMMFLVCKMRRLEQHEHFHLRSGDLYFQLFPLSCVIFRLSHKARAAGVMRWCTLHSLTTKTKWLYTLNSRLFFLIFVLFLVFGRINIASLLLSLPYSVAPEWKSRFGSTCSAMCSCRVQPGREGVKLRVQRCAEGAYRSKVKPMICIFGRIEIHKS